MTATTPRYASGIRFASEAVRKDAYDVMARLVEHYRATSTDMVAEQWREPVANYRDPQLWERELQAVHRTVPLPLALSCELPAAGSYKAVDAVGTPVVITRQRDGSLRAVVNACRHRGGELVPEGTGTTRRFICPYHSWSYDLSGRLMGVYGEETFGPVDKPAMGLVSLPVGERAGIVFVSLDRTADLDLDAWLGEDLLALLEGLDLAGCYHHSTRTLEGPNWKVVVDGYLEGYHFASLHKDTLFKDTLSNLMAVDAHGPHQRVAFARRSLATLRDLPEEEWDPTAHVGPVYTLFPCLSLAGGWRDQAMVSQLFPGPTSDRSRTVQTIITRHPVVTDEDRARTTAYTDFLYDVVRDEDYATGFAITGALASGANEELVFGRNEMSLHHFHRWVDRLVDAGDA